MRLPSSMFLAFIFGTCIASTGQSGLDSADATDAATFRILFNRDLLLNQLADEADTAGTPKPHFRKKLGNRFALADADRASLHRLALRFKEESDPLHAKVLISIASLNSRFPNGVIPHGVDASPPPELHLLELQEDALALRYRDLLHNAMLEADFQLLQTKVRATFGHIPSK